VENNGIVPQQFSHASQLLAQGGSKGISLQFDEAQVEFEAAWTLIHKEFGNRPDEAPAAAKKLIAAQPRVIGLTLAMARCDSSELFGRFKRFLEFILKRTERMPGYPAIAGVPHVQAGFLYMAATVMAFHWEAWNLFEKLLTTKFEWYYQSGRPIFSYPFDLPYFFHSEALGRDGAKIHDYFRNELAEPDVVSVTRLTGDSTLDVYVQTQMLMCLKVAQLREVGEAEMVSIWPDFGRFYSERVIRLLDRAYADREFSRGLLRAFNEDADTFFNSLNSRLAVIQSVFWQGSPYFYESLRSWEPKQAHA
jgi:hypothetical protein